MAVVWCRPVGVEFTIARGAGKTIAGGAEGENAITNCVGAQYRAQEG
jgi:hypothetical protein